MLYYPISALVISFSSLFFGFFIIYKNFKSKVNIFYFAFCLSAFWWSFFYFFWQIASNASSALFFLKLLMVGAIYSSFFYLTCVVYFVNKQLEYKKTLYILFLINIVWLFSNIFTNEFIVGVESKLNFPYWPIPGIFFHPFLFTFFLEILLASYLLVITIKHAKGLLRPQAQYMLIGLGLAFLGGSTNYFLWYDIPIPPYGNILVVSFVVFTGYAILKYRFLDIRVVIKRSLIFTVLVLLITSIFSASAFFLSSFVQTFFGQNSILVSGAITGVLVAIGFEPIKLWLTRVTDSVLFKGQVDPQVALSRASTKISALLDVRKLGEVIANTAYEVLKFDKLKVYIFDEVVQGYRLVHKVGQGGSQDLTQDNLIYQYYQIYEQDIQNKQIIAIDELRYLVTQTQDEFLTQLVAYMEQHHIALVVPLYIKNEALGFIFLGEKKSGDPYTNEDLNFLHILGAQAGISFKNAKLYEEQLKFADTLQQEVDKATKELKSANKELKKLDQAKSEFISIASHQLRTPMTAIKGYMSMVEDGDFGQVPDKIQKPVHAVLESSNRLLRLIEDLLNISRIESGRMQYEFEMGNVQTLVESVFEELQNHAKKKNLEFVYHAPQEPIPDIPMDTMKVREVVMNLADNAIKYTDTGTVELFLEVKGNEVKYWVKDTGRGLTAEDKGKLFKKFSRVGSSQLVHTEGTGLGLYIAKQIIKKHKGKLWAESEGAMKGSVFALSLKINNPELEQLIDDTAVSLDRDIVKKQMNEPMEDTIDMSRIKIRKDRK